LASTSAGSGGRDRRSPRSTVDVAERWFANVRPGGRDGVGPAPGLKGLLKEQRITIEGAAASCGVASEVMHQWVSERRSLQASAGRRLAILVRMDAPQLLQRARRSNRGSTPSVSRLRRAREANGLTQGK
jgi:hypothetical protein